MKKRTTIYGTNYNNIQLMKHNKTNSFKIKQQAHIPLMLSKYFPIQLYWVHKFDN